MIRRHNTDRNGYGWSEEYKISVWAKAVQIIAQDPTSMRRDKCGKIILWNQYGNRNSEYGWEIDHINPVANGGGDELSNLQHLYWKSNAEKSDSLNWKCPQ